MSIPVSDSMPRAMQIGLVAYGLDGPNPSLVFVRVPTERGRWMLTHRCVVEVACDLCGAIVGEPCRSQVGGPGRAMKHGTMTHVRRRDAWQTAKRGKADRGIPKVRLSADDLSDAMAVAP